MAETIRFTAGAPEIVALKFGEGKTVSGKFGDQVMFTCTDGRAFYLDPLPASDVERELQDLGIRVGQPFRLTKVKQSHGGHSFHVERTGDSGGHNVPSRSGEGAPSWQSNAPAARAVATTPTNTPILRTETAAPEAFPSITPAVACMCSAMMAAVDAVMETQAYAARKGLGLTFSEESVRAIGLSIYISNCKGGR